MCIIFSCLIETSISVLISTTCIFIIHDCAVVDEAMVSSICMCFLQLHYMELSWPPHLWHIVPVENLTPSGAVGVFFAEQMEKHFYEHCFGLEHNDLQINVLHLHATSRTS